jgi:branched-chain amino acid aminotransferase
MRKRLGKIPRKHAQYMMYVFLNGLIVPEPEARISVYDHGFLYGDGIYETMRCYEGVVFMMDRHLERLRRSASLIRLGLPEDDYLKDAVMRAAAANNLADAYIRITVSRGRGPIGLDPALCEEPTLIVFAEQFKSYPVSLYREGVRLIIAGTRRNLVSAIDPKIKSLNFLNNILAKIEAKEKGAYEAVMLNAEGFIAEGTVSNVFFAAGGALCTPSADVGILDGITRELVIGLALEEGIEVREGKFTPEDLVGASEVFFTNTTSEVMPVCAVDGRNYRVGEITKILQQRYRAYVEEYIRSRKSRAF